MSPPGRGGDADRDALEALRARLVDAERASKQPKKQPMRAKDAHKSRTSRRSRTSQASRASQASQEEEAVEAAETTLEEPGAREPWWEDEELRGGPRPVVGGLSARTRKGPIGETWWSRRFLGSIESVMVGGRMGSGRAYARKGQVVDLQIAPGVVVAAVQGSREEPYLVHLRMSAVPDDDWDRIVRALAERAGYAARMLAGDLPTEVEEVFESEGASLLPAPHARLVTECTCPDWENPCKHIAAVCYLLAESFDRDPFSLLAWRGRERGEVLAALRALRREGAAAGGDGDGDSDTVDDVGATGIVDTAGTGPASPGQADTGSALPDGRDLLERFWEPGPELVHVRLRPEESAVAAAALRLAPRGVLTVRGGDLVDVLAPAYGAMAAAAAARARR